MHGRIAMALTLASALALTVDFSGAATVARHFGDVDPATEGWAAQGSGVGVVTGPIDDGGTLAWIVRDASTAPDSDRYYRQVLPESVLDVMTDEGWVLTATVRIPDPSTRGPGASLLFHAATRAYGIQFGSRPNGDPYFRVITIIENHPSIEDHTVVGGAGTYHAFELIVAPHAVSAEIRIDGVVVDTEYLGFENSLQPGYLVFGCAPEGTGENRFHLVEVQSGSDVPVPALATSWGRIKASYRGTPAGPWAP